MGKSISVFQDKWWLQLTIIVAFVGTNCMVWSNVLEGWERLLSDMVQGRKSSKDATEMMFFKVLGNFGENIALWICNLRWIEGFRGGNGVFVFVKGLDVARVFVKSNSKVKKKCIEWTNSWKWFSVKMMFVETEKCVRWQRTDVVTIDVVRGVAEQKQVWVSLCESTATLIWTRREIGVRDWGRDQSDNPRSESWVNQAEICPCGSEGWTDRTKLPVAQWKSSDLLWSTRIRLLRSDIHWRATNWSYQRM